ncbi:MAG TPA: hypothetical protein PK767_02745 [Clostridiales bacterium]|nr:hypothetical protein [Clostridiales bacterium]HOL91365.1 hypothetical protein [Clostridiales bacterium]HPP35145.1 hypothetical protein [Clostridiales bacterium]
MRSEKLMDYIGQIDDSFIIEADSQPANTKSARRPRIKWVPAAIAAACLIISSAFLLILMRPSGPVDLPDLPKLTVNTDLGSFGFEGLMAYNIDELRNGNPWTENNDLETMPVFANPHEYDSAGAPVSGLTPEEMLAEAEKIADIFGLDVTSLYTEPALEEIEQIIQKMEAIGASEEEISRNTSIFYAAAKCNGAEIRVEKDGHVYLSLTPETAHLAEEIEKLSAYESFEVSFDIKYKTEDGTMYSTGLPLPAGYSFTFSNTSNEQALEITQYLYSKYGAFTGITTPGFDVAADYTFSGVLTRPHTFVFENEGTLTDRILNYNFRRLYFYATDSGGLGGISYYNADLSKKIGDYPIITAEEARRLLLEGHYITSVPEALPGKRYIAHVELIYRAGRLDTVFMPYYRFLVELPSMELENGLKTYGAFYVPAVRSEYLENMPVWDGSFN